VRHTIRREPGSTVVIEAEIDAGRLARAADTAFQRHVQRAQIPGFRPGKAPRAMYERTYGKEHLWDDAGADLVDETYRDIVTVEVDATIPDRKVPPFARNAHVEAGKPLGIAGLGEALVGLKAGETKSVELKFPDDASEGDLRGRAATFSFRPSQVSEKVLPALDDEFAKTVGVSDLAALRKAVRNELAHAAFHESRDDA